MIVLLLFVLFNNFLLSEEDKKIPKLDLRNNDLVIDLSIDVLGTPIDRSQILIQAQIDEIKNKAKEFKIDPVTDDDIVIFETNLGIMKINLYNDLAPNHCKNFKKLSNSGFYDETLIFRVVPNFMIQAGDLLTRDGNPKNDGTGNPGWIIDAEINDLQHKKGILSMAHGADINSAGSQFFICTGDAKHLDKNYTAFGEIIENYNLLEIIQNIPSESKQILSMAESSIPEDSNDSWLTYFFNDNKLFFKIPINETENSYRQFISDRINNIYRPSIPITIKKIRVVNRNSISKTEDKNKLDFNFLKGLNKQVEDNNE